MLKHSTGNGFTRYGVLTGAVLVQLCIGAIYTWSLFNQPLSQLHGWRQEDVLLAYSINILAFALTTMLSGRLQDRFGPRLIASLGAVALGAGVFLTGGADTLSELYLYYGLLAGVGVGLVYPCPLATCIKWFPASKGLITGIAVGAFGLGGLLFKDLILYLLDTQGVILTFKYLGYLYLCTVLAGAQLLRLPEPLGSPGVIGTGPGRLRDVVMSMQFMKLWITFFFGTVSGLLILGMVKDLGGLAGMSPAEAAHLVGVASLSNAGGRLGYGLLSDRLGRWRMVGLINLLTAGAILLLAFAPLEGSRFTAALILIVSGFGGLLAIYPAITAETFGVSSLGRNYGMIFAAYGLAAFIGPFISGHYPLRVILTGCAVLALCACLASFAAGTPRSKRRKHRNGLNSTPA